MLLSVYNRIPELYAFCRSAYSQPSCLLFGPYIVSCEDGVQPDWSLLFCNTMHPPLSSLYASPSGIVQECWLTSWSLIELFSQSSILPRCLFSTQRTLAVCPTQCFVWFEAPGRRSCESCCSTEARVGSVRSTWVSLWAAPGWTHAGFTALFVRKLLGKQPDITPSTI